jgi:hypothetical protein
VLELFDEIRMYEMWSFEDGFEYEHHDVVSAFHFGSRGHCFGAYQMIQLRLVVFRTF